MSEKQELMDRIEARRKRLEARLKNLQADARSDASDAQERIRERLDELKQSYGQKADDISEAAAAKLNDWLKRTED